METQAVKMNDFHDITLVVNPGSASRKYALYANDTLRAMLHVEYENGRLVYRLTYGTESIADDLADVSIEGVTAHIEHLFRNTGVLQDTDVISRIGLRIVAPSGFFLYDHLLDDDVLARLKALQPRAPLHIAATLGEYQELRRAFPEAAVVGVSDSAFHATKPDYAWNYGLPLADSDRLELKRFGYHGLSVASVVRTLRDHGKLPPRLVVCHLGSGASVTAVWHGKSRDTTMGYSPLDGLIMATRSGSLDAALILVLKAELGLNDRELEEYLNHRSGLLGLSGISADIRDLLREEAQGNHYARLALETYIFTVQKAIGQMIAALGGVDVLVFTGTVGERSAVIRQRIMQGLHYLDFSLDSQANEACITPARRTLISRVAHSRPAFVIPADEAAEIAHRTRLLYSQ